jgi:MoaD family protein
MRINVEYFGQLRELTAVNREHIEVPAPCSVGEALTYLAQQHGQRFANLVLSNGQPTNSLLLAIGEQQATTETLLQDGDELLIVPPVSGG